MGATQGINKMSLRDFAAATLPETASQDYDWEYERMRWNDDVQRMPFLTVGEHIQVAKTLKPQFMEIVADIIIQAGYYTPEDRDALIEKLMSQPERTRTYLDGNLGFTWRLKAEDCATEKLKDSSVNQNPGRIGDYFAVKLVPDTVEGVVRLRQAAIDTAMTSRKCEFSKPSDEGFRSHKSHHEAEAGLLNQKFEVLISHADLEAVSELTHRLKEVERSMAGATLALAQADMIPAKNRNKLSTRMSGVGDDAKALRTAINDAVAYQTGIDDLALPEFRHGEPDLSELRITSTASRRVLGNMRGDLSEQLTGILGQVVSAHSSNPRTQAANGREFAKT